MKIEIFGVSESAHFSNNGSKIKIIKMRLNIKTGSNKRTQNNYAH
jgi:hypothetical protein